MFTQVYWIVLGIVLSVLIDTPYNIVQRRLKGGVKVGQGWCTFAKRYQIIKLFVVAIGSPILTIALVCYRHWILGGVMLIATVILYSRFVNNARRYNSSGWFHKQVI